MCEEKGQNITSKFVAKVTGKNSEKNVKNATVKDVTSLFLLESKKT